jgi:hypothetical protein
VAQLPVPMAFYTDQELKELLYKMEYDILTIVLENTNCTPKTPYQTIETGTMV